MAKQKTIYCCSDCGNETANWAGRCPSCGAWNTLEEVKLEAGRRKGASYIKSARTAPQLKRLSELDTSAEIRFMTGISEFDRVLGGGAVAGSLILVGGAPGIGKSTLLLQMCGSLESGRTVLYVTGEESERQLKLRATRLGVGGGDTYVLAETDMDNIIAAIDNVSPDIVIIDSIQTVSDAESSSAPGSLSQIKECTMRIMRVTKEKGLTVFVVGHINKEGSIAGPKVLEHMVDCVLYFEGERSTSFRILRAAKNRFGSTNEIGVFEMVDKGLRCVENPSEVFLSGRPENSPGTCVSCIVEGTRPILAEVQALVAPTTYNAARRCNGIDYNRAAMLLAVLEKRGGLPVGGCDAYINVIGGLSLDEPAADLATVLAVASSFLDRPLGTDLAAFGEVGLSGEIRSVSALNQRLGEISRLGFRRCVIPAHVRDEVKHFDGLELIAVKNVGEAMAAVLGKNMLAVKSPNLPEQAGTVVLGQKYSNSLAVSLEKHGIKALFVPDNCRIDPRLSGHADLSILHMGGKELWLAPYLKGSSFSDTLDSMGFELFYPDIRQSALYPGDAQLNICICGKRAICNSPVIPDSIDEYFTNMGCEVVNVRQGYARCSVCVVDENAVITADRGIGAAVRSAGMDVLLISPGHIELPGYDYGFIGGASFKLSKDKMAFTGSLDAHPDKESILAFLKLHNIEPIYLTDKPAFDIGSGIPITET